MRNLDIKKIAKLTALDANVDSDIAIFVLDKLTRRQLLEYLRHLKAFANRKTVRVVSSEPISEMLKRNIVKRFPDKKVLFLQEEIGDGIKIQINDTVIDFSIHSYIDTAIDRLKEEI